MNDGHDRDRADGERGDEDRVEDCAPGQVADPTPGGRPGYLRRIFSRGAHGASSKPSAALSSALSKRRCPPGVVSVGCSRPRRTARLRVGWLTPSSRAAWPVVMSLAPSGSSCRELAYSSTSVSLNRRWPPGVTSAARRT